MKIKIAGFVPESVTDGPGIRCTIFAQGCPHHCKGCHNPQTLDENSGKFVEIDRLMQKITQNPMITGVTFSGGEPFEQALPFAKLADNLKAENMNIWCYTGYTIEHLLENADDKNNYMELISKIDTLVDGRFILSQRDLNLQFRGSRNQRIIDVPKSLQSGKIFTSNETEEQP